MLPATPWSRPMRPSRACDIDITWITRIIPICGLPKTSNNIIQKGLAFVREQSGSVTIPGARRALGILPRRLHGRGGAVVVAAAMTPHQRNGDPDVKTHRYPTRHSVLGFAAQ